MNLKSLFVAFLKFTLQFFLLHLCDFLRFNQKFSKARRINLESLKNFLDEAKIKRGEVLPLEVEAQVDNGATSVVFPKDVAERLNLAVARKTWVKYANQTFSFPKRKSSIIKKRRGIYSIEKREQKEVVRGLVIEILGRSTICEAIVEPERKTALVGQFVLEVLDLWIDSKNGKLIPNPESPDMPLLDEI
ncbi:hypothetical protein FJZ31_13150 [Candidatus Poribacteria bacterium]|nr:hypothetical protein [Candidatus Poribacteria bacterium]